MGRLRKDSCASVKLQKCKNFIMNGEEYKGKWNELVFKNKNPIFIEIGTGKGKFIYELAKTHMDINFIAIDKYETVLLKLAKKEGIELMTNLKILSFDASLIDQFFDNGEVSKIYLNFPDPWPKKRHSKRRLTSIDFINLYKKILDKKGWIEFKTDNKDFFDYSLDIIKENNFKIFFLSYDLLKDDVNNVKTEYEIKFSNQNIKINKVSFNPFNIESKEMTKC